MQKLSGHGDGQTGHQRNHLPAWVGRFRTPDFPHFRGQQDGEGRHRRTAGDADDLPGERIDADDGGRQGDQQWVSRRPEERWRRLQVQEALPEGAGRVMEVGERILPVEPVETGQGEHNQRGYRQQHRGQQGEPAQSVRGKENRPTRRHRIDAPNARLPANGFADHCARGLM